jgi:hypothetical protein
MLIFPTMIEVLAREKIDMPPIRQTDQTFKKHRSLLEMTQGSIDYQIKKMAHNERRVEAGPKPRPVGFLLAWRRRDIG